MKTITIIGGMAAPLAAMSLTALIGGAAAAQTPPAAQPGARHARADADGDGYGRINQAEFVQARTGRLAALDADRDGALTAQEVRARIQARMAERAGLRFDRLDADHDGFTTADEGRAARMSMREHRQDRRAERMARRTVRRTPASPPAPASE